MNGYLAAFLISHLSFLISHFFKFCVDLVRDFLEFLFSQFEMFFAEVDISLTVHRDEVDVCMRNFQTQNNLCHFFARESSLDGLCHFLGEYFKLSQVCILHIEDVVHLLARNHQSMTFADRANVEESIELVAFCTLVARNLSCCNL